MKNIKYYIFAALCLCAVLAAMAAFGVWFGLSVSDNLPILAAVSAAVIIVFAALNAVLLIIRGNSKFQFNAVYKQLNKSDDKTPNRRMYLIKMCFCLLAGYIYGAVLCASAFILGVFCVANGNGLMLIGAILAAYFIINICFGLLGIKKADDFNVSLDKSFCPELYKLAEATAEKLKIKAKIQFERGGECGLAAIEDENACYLDIGALTLLILSRSETEALICYELGRICNKFTDRHRLALGARSRFDNMSQSIAPFIPINRLFLGIYADRGTILSELFRRSFNSERSDSADEAVKMLGAEQAFIDALAKLSAFDIVSTLPTARLMHSVYTSPPEKYTEYLLEEFKRDYANKKQMIDGFLINNLPSRLSPRYTLKQNMERLGVGKFNIDFSFEKDAALTADGEKLAADYDAFWLENYGKQWEYDRKTQYLPLLDEIRDFEANRPTDSKSLASVAFAYEATGNVEKGMELYDAALALDANNAYALLRKGITLAAKNDGECVPMLKRAVELNYTYSEAIIDIIGGYYKRNGMESEEKAFREWSLNLVQTNVIERSSDYTLNGRSRLETTMLPEGVMTEIKLKLQETPVIAYAKITTKLLDKGRKVHIIMIGFIEGAATEDIERGFNSLAFFLDNLIGDGMDFALMPEYAIAPIPLEKLQFITDLYSRGAR